MNLILFACSESAALDSFTQRVSIFHVIDEMNAPNFPAVHGNMAVTAVATRTATEPNNFTLQIGAEIGGAIIFDLPVQLDFQQHLRARLLTSIQGVPVPKPGNLRITAKESGKVLAFWDI